MRSPLSDDFRFCQVDITLARTKVTPKIFKIHHLLIPAQPVILTHVADVCV